MMQDWLRNCSSEYLRCILRGESIESNSPECSICLSTGTVYSCTDCFYDTLLCVDCVKAAHSRLPTHHLRRWTGTHFERVSSKDIGYIFHLGHRGLPCDLGYNRLFTLIDSNGVHELTLRFCRHPSFGDGARQLLKAHVYPCSDDRPSSGATFSVLRLSCFLPLRQSCPPIAITMS
jgi:hypothetical protein